MALRWWNLLQLQIDKCCSWIVGLFTHAHFHRGENLTSMSSVNVCTFQDSPLSPNHAIVAMFPWASWSSIRWPRSLLSLLQRLPVKDGGLLEICTPVIKLHQMVSSLVDSANKIWRILIIYQCCLVWMNKRLLMGSTGVSLIRTAVWGFYLMFLGSGYSSKFNR